MENKLTPVKLTEGELSMVDNNLLEAKQLKYLLKKTPAKHTFKRVAKGGGEWTYVTGAYVKKVLNLMFGWDWSFEVKENKFDLRIGQAFVLGRLTINTKGRSIYKEQFGRVDIKFKNEWIDGKKVKSDIPLDLGNDLKAAATDALKKCAAELGIASDIYAPDEFTPVDVVDKAPLPLSDEEENEAILLIETCEDQERLTKLYNSDIRYRTNENLSIAFKEKNRELIENKNL